FAQQPRSRGLGRHHAKQLDRHRPCEPCIARTIDFAHPAGADARLDVESVEARTGRQRPRALPGDVVIPLHRPGRPIRRHFEKTGRTIVRRNQGFDFAAQLEVWTARFGNPGGTLRGRPVERTLHDVNHLAPAWRHGTSSRYSHALATFHSRPTVDGDTRTTAAVSSIVSPPK